MQEKLVKERMASKGRGQIIQHVKLVLWLTFLNYRYPRIQPYNLIQKIHTILKLQRSNSATTTTTQLRIQYDSIQHKIRKLVIQFNVQQLVIPFRQHRSSEKIIGGNTSS